MIKSSWVTLVTILAFCISLVLGGVLVAFHQNLLYEEREKQVREINARFAYTIQDHLNRSLSATYALAALIRQGNGRIEHFDLLGSEMLPLYGGISSLQLAPDGVIRQVYPRTGNEKAIGLNLLSDRQRSQEAMLAISSRRLSLAGPFELIQGGKGVVGRIPVFLDAANGKERFWGLVSVVIRIPDFLATVPLQQAVHSGYHYELSRVNPTTGKREVITRSSSEPLHAPVRANIEVPNGVWTLSMEPRDGWHALSELAAEGVLVLLISTLLAALLRTMARQPLLLKLKVEERTRQLSESNTLLAAEMEERVRAEEILRASESRQRTLLDNIPLGITLVDREHRIVMVNRTTSEWFGRAAESFVGKHCYEQFKNRERICDYCPGIVSVRSGLVSNIDTEGVRADGGTFAVHLRTFPLLDQSGGITGFIEVVEDITGLKRAEDALRLSEAKLKESQRVAHIGHYEFDIEARLWTCSEELEEIFGIDDAYSRDLNGWLTIIAPDQREEMSTYLQREVLGKRQGFDREYRIVRVSDRAERWVHGLGQLELGPDGHPVRMFGTIQDITARKRADEERQKLEAQMQHAQKLESLGVLAGGIAHDFNNILLAILGHADLALMRLSAASPGRENLHQIELAAQRAAELARQMLAYSGKGRFVIETLDLGEIIMEMTHMLEVSISKKAVLRLNLAKDLPPIQVDVTQVRQVLMNLVINASEAIGDASGVIAITTGAMHCDREYFGETWLDEQLPEGTYVFVEVADTGCGMDRETISRVFDPFFTTKFAGRGLGMAAVLGIVRGHKGAVKVYSEPRKGTTFKVLFPVAQGHAEALRERVTSQELWHGSGTVLLVDDEETVRALGTEMLQALGFDVLTAKDGREALGIFREHQDIKAVILDLTMPHMDGEETFRELRRTRSDVRVVMSSGYNEQEVCQRFLGKGLAGFIQKPYRLAELGAVLRETLEPPEK
ncbi:PAS domain S-box protein [Geomesophilobacter sediminis]|uniref:histidine kinase n=1 Tax=Geomesophilobacter sediminis TaxID=2798584 RepID=A0A8J7IMS3_9BACT|nr:PAS domain S-box protein [Geomesophilobacter sediminis]MBJ6724188.1 PAS domain S-box protein [Geomesophilobacter sediminis]